MRALGGWLRRRDIDAETLAHWLAVLAWTAGCWALVGYLIWRTTGHG